MQLWASPVALNVSPGRYYLHKLPTWGRKARFCYLIFVLLTVSAGSDRIEARWEAFQKHTAKLNSRPNQFVRSSVQQVKTISLLKTSPLPSPWQWMFCILCAFHLDYALSGVHLNKIKESIFVAVRNYNFISVSFSCGGHRITLCVLTWSNTTRVWGGRNGGPDIWNSPVQWYFQAIGLLAQC